jgi:hypothetical protein
MIRIIANGLEHVNTLLLTAGQKCNLGAAAVLRNLIDRRAILLACGLACSTSSAPAQGLVPPAADAGAFLAGGAVALAMHEAGHLTLDVLFGASPGIKKVSFARIPFFAITHDTQSPVREFVISSAGFWVQETSNEILLTRHPRPPRSACAVLQRAAGVNTLASVAYSGRHSRVWDRPNATRGGWLLPRACASRGLAHRCLRRRCSTSRGTTSRRARGFGGRAGRRRSRGALVLRAAD